MKKQIAVIGAVLVVCAGALFACQSKDQAVPTVAVSENTSSSTSQEQATSEQQDAIYTNEVNSVYDNQTEETASPAEETASPAEDTETSSQQEESETSDGDYTREEDIALLTKVYMNCGMSEEEARAEAEASYESTKAAEAEREKRSDEALAVDIAKADAEIKKMEERCLQQTGMTRDEWFALGMTGQHEWCLQHPGVDVSGF